MMLTAQKRIAAGVFKCSPKKVHFDEGLVFAGKEAVKQRLKIIGVDAASFVRDAEALLEERRKSKASVSVEKVSPKSVAKVAVSDELSEEDKRLQEKKSAEKIITRRV